MDSRIPGGSMVGDPAVGV